MTYDEKNLTSIQKVFAFLEVSYVLLAIAYLVGAGYITVKTIQFCMALPANSCW